MKLHISNIGGDVAKQDDRYVVVDNTDLSNMVLSSTTLYSGKSTSGHSHPGQEEIYFFISGTGEMELDSEKFTVNAGDTVLVHDGVFHRVHNTDTDTPLYFVCVFEGSRSLK